MNRSASAILFCLALCATAIGCGPAMGSVSGTVTMDGQPAEAIQVDFQPVAGDVGGAMGVTDAQGNYTLYYPGEKTGAPPGEYIVRLTGAERESSPGLVVPPKYNVESDLKRTVVAGANDFDFEIESK
jgi:hypothetical protein